MDVGCSLPTMAAGADRALLRRWCAGIDAGPFRSISCGERITFHNPEMMTTLAAAAALTERVQVFVNLAVAPLHPTGLLAKQLATIDLWCDGRLEVGLGVGGREHDYRAAEAAFDHRHHRLDEQVAELRRLWRGEPAFPGGAPVGPSPVQPAGPPLLAGAMGPRALARAARWADGVSGFSLGADPEEMARAARRARRAWAEAGRADEPRLVTGCFTVLGGQDPLARLRRFTDDYLAIFGPDLAAALAAGVDVADADRLLAALDVAEDLGYDEVVLVPGTWDPECLAALADVVSTWRSGRAA